MRPCTPPAGGRVVGRGTRVMICDLCQHAKAALGGSAPDQPRCMRLGRFREAPHTQHTGHACCMCCLLHSPAAASSCAPWQMAAMGLRVSTKCLTSSMTCKVSVEGLFGACAAHRACACAAVWRSFHAGLQGEIPSGPTAGRLATQELLSSKPRHCTQQAAAQVASAGCAVAGFTRISAGAHPAVEAEVLWGAAAAQGAHGREWRDEGDAAHTSVAGLLSAKQRAASTHSKIRHTCQQTHSHRSTPAHPGMTRPS